MMTLLMALGLLTIIGLFIVDILDTIKENKARKEWQQEKMNRIAWEEKMEAKRARYAATGIWE